LRIERARPPLVHLRRRRRRRREGGGSTRSETSATTARALSFLRKKQERRPRLPPPPLSNVRTAPIALSRRALESCDPTSVKRKPSQPWPPSATDNDDDDDDANSATAASAPAIVGADEAFLISFPMRVLDGLAMRDELPTERGARLYRDRKTQAGKRVWSQRKGSNGRERK